MPNAMAVRDDRLL